MNTENKLTAIRQNLREWLATPWPDDVPEVSGCATATYHFKVRVTFPWDRFTESLTRRDQRWERDCFIRSLGETLRISSPKAPLAVNRLVVSERASKLFKAPGNEPGLVALLSVALDYSAHRRYAGAELRVLLEASVNHARYPDKDLRIEVAEQF